MEQVSDRSSDPGCFIIVNWSHPVFHAAYQVKRRSIPSGRSYILLKLAIIFKMSTFSKLSIIVELSTLSKLSTFVKFSTFSKLSIYLNIFLSLSFTHFSKCRPS
uniref:Uncharacterized protein n=1 Tax=Trichuris muris TaxID=70415 RepID=A0A5S6Q1Z6_TRIMR